MLSVSSKFRTCSCAIAFALSVSLHLWEKNKFVLQLHLIGIASLASNADGKLGIWSHATAVDA